MITIDRDAGLPVVDQLVDQLRYLIVAGRFKIGEMLPSTRALAEQVEVSFHTVRKAYQTLEQEGLVSSRVGSGYRVEERAPLSKGDRMERGAGVVQEMLQKLISLGLTEQEIDYVIQEQMTFFSTVPRSHKLLFVAPYRELAESGARQLEAVLQEAVEPITPDQLSLHPDADHAICRFEDLHQVSTALPRAEIHGVVIHLHRDVLEKLAWLMQQNTVSLVTRHEDATQPLLAALKAATGFKGQFTATIADVPLNHLSRFARQCDLLLFTPACRRKLSPFLEKTRHQMIQHLIDAASLDQLKKKISV